MFLFLSLRELESDIDEHHNFSVQSSHSHRVTKDASQINSCHIEGPRGIHGGIPNPWQGNSDSLSKALP